MLRIIAQQWFEPFSSFLVSNSCHLYFYLVAEDQFADLCFEFGIELDGVVRKIEDADEAILLASSSFWHLPLRLFLQFPDEKQARRAEELIWHLYCCSDFRKGPTREGRQVDRRSQRGAHLQG